jgi:competence protein ComEC
MLRRGRKFLFSGAAILCLSLGLFFIFYHPPRLLEADFLDVGQGDAELIRTPYGQKILIDGGPDNTVLSRLGGILPFWDRSIDLVILTHPHDDHFSGLIDVLKKYQVKLILMTEAESNVPSFQEFVATVRNKKTPVIFIEKKQTVVLGEGLRLEILHPEKGDWKNKDLNETSIVARLDYYDDNFLFMGDAGVATEKELLGEKVDLHAEVLKVGHHGSDSASSLDFLRAVAPQIAVIECGLDNKFGHPKADTLWRLTKAGAEIFRTDRNGTIKIKSDGKNINVKNGK